VRRNFIGQEFVSVAEDGIRIDAIPLAISKSGLGIPTALRTGSAMVKYGGGKG
jgi:hypothetical protein